LAFDVSGGQINTNGAKVQLYHRGTNNNAQIWETEPNTSRIKVKNSGKCLDAGNGYFNGGLVHLWDCHNGGNQQWITHPDGTIRPINNQNFCLDASNGVRNESRIHLWQCHGEGNQNFRMGENDFSSSSNLSIELATCTNCSNYIPVFGGGHTWVTMRKDSMTTNTFSIWENDKFDGSSSNIGGSTNNIKTGGHTNIIVDAKNPDAPFGDFGLSQSMCENYGKACKFRRVYIPKAKYDEIKFMRGYLYHENIRYNTHSWNCVDYAMALFEKYTNYDYDPVKYKAHSLTGYRSDPTKLYYYMSSSRLVVTNESARHETK
jgi:hypothetical protein